MIWIVLWQLLLTGLHPLFWVVARLHPRLRPHRLERFGVFDAEVEPEHREDAEVDRKSVV